MNRSRLTYRAHQTTATLKQISEELPFNATLLQIIMRFQGAIVSSESVTIWKASGVDAVYNALVKSYDPSITEAEYVPCLEMNVEYLKGDTVGVEFQNTDLLIVGYELIFKEGD